MDECVNGGQKILEILEMLMLTLLNCTWFLWNSEARNFICRKLAVACSCSFPRGSRRVGIGVQSLGQSGTLNSVNTPTYQPTTQPRLSHPPLSHPPVIHSPLIHQPPLPLSDPIPSLNLSPISNLGPLPNPKLNTCPITGLVPIIVVEEVGV